MSLVPSRVIKQKQSFGACTTESTAVLDDEVSMLAAERDIHAISGKLSTNGTVRRLEARSRVPPSPATTNSSHNWSTSANQMSFAADRWNLLAEKPSVSSEVGLPTWSVWMAVGTVMRSSPSACFCSSLVTYAVPCGAEKSTGPRPSHVTQLVPRLLITGWRWDRDRQPLSPIWQFVMTAFDSWICKPSRPPYAWLTSTTESVGGSITYRITWNKINR